MNRVYLTGVEIGDGCFSSESAVSGCDIYRGYSGFFEKDMIVDGGLEVEVCNSDGEKVAVRPSRGQRFLERSHIVVDVGLLRVK